MFIADNYPQNNSQHTKSPAVLTLAAFSTCKSGQGVGRHKFRSFFCLLKFMQILTALLPSCKGISTAKQKRKPALNWVNQNNFSTI